MSDGERRIGDGKNGHCWEEVGLDKCLRIEGEQGEGGGKERREGRRRARDSIVS